jgi:hypothetical protein
MKKEERKKGITSKMAYQACLTFFIFPFSLFFCIPVFAHEQTAVREDLWVCPVFESGLYSVSSMAIGGGMALGYGDRVAFGLKVIYWNDLEEISAWELIFLARLYFFRIMGAEVPWRSGLFIQFNSGPVIFVTPPAIGTISAGFSLGWRFLFGEHFFVEPALRAGYPYIAGAELSAGLRF